MKHIIPQTMYQHTISSFRLSEFVILIIRNRFKPLVGGVLAGNIERKMCELTVGGSTMPMLDICRDMDDCSRQNRYRRLTLFLIPAATGYAGSIPRRRGRRR